MPTGTPVKVVDASALAAAVFGEAAGLAVSRRLADSPLVAPTLLRYELGNVCLTKIRRYPEQRRELLQALARFPSLGVQEVDVPTWESTELGERESLTAYDAAYLWLARSLGAELVTLDERLQAAASR